MKLTVEPGEAYAVVRPAGRLTVIGAPLVRQAVDELVEDGRTRIVIDLAGTEFIDSSGLGALIGALKAARLAGGDLRIAAAPDQVRMVLRLTNLDRVLRNHDSAEVAFDGD